MKYGTSEFRASVRPRSLLDCGFLPRGDEII